VGGLLIPDIPLEETTEARELCAKYGLELVLLATPTTPSARMEKIAAATNGFVYLVSVTGVTGVQDKMEERVQGLVRRRSELLRRPHARAHPRPRVAPPTGCQAEEGDRQARGGGLWHLQARPSRAGGIMGS
jgi:hypothetical protein